MKLVSIVAVATAMLGGCFLESVAPLGLAGGPEPVEFWTKDYVTTAAKATDWAACGGSPNGGVPYPTRKQIQEKWRPGDQVSAGIHDWHVGKVAECMAAKGYKHTRNYNDAAWRAGQKAMGRTD